MLKKEKVIIYSAEQSSHLFVKILSEIWQEIPQAHELGLRLFKRNLKALYRQTMLGFGWALIPPLLIAFLWVFLRNNGVISVGETGIRYPVFVIIGTLLWQLFSDCILTPLKIVTENKNIISKINIPREGLLLAGIYELLFNLLIKLSLIFAIMIFYGQSFWSESLLFLPIGLFAILITGFSLGLILTPVGLLFQDIRRGLTVILPFLMYLTPIIYPAPMHGALNIVMKINPLATIIPVTRQCLTGQPILELTAFWIYTIAFTLLFFLALIIYRISMPMIIERIGN